MKVMIVLNVSYCELFVGNWMPTRGSECLDNILTNFDRCLYFTSSSDYFTRHGASVSVAKALS